jgi:hypothetical protein
MSKDSNENLKILESRPYPILDENLDLISFSKDLD